MAVPLGGHFVFSDGLVRSALSRLEGERFLQRSGGNQAVMGIAWISRLLQAYSGLWSAGGFADRDISDVTASSILSDNGFDPVAGTWVSLPSYPAKTPSMVSALPGTQLRFLMTTQLSASLGYRSREN